MEISSKLNRRKVLKGAAAASLTVFATPLLAQAKPIKIGYVTPKTGPLAAFAEADDFILNEIRQSLAGGIKVAGETRSIEIVVRDSQSSQNRAAEVASELILREEITMMLVSSAPETTNPVSDQCELNQTPCLSTVAPWQSWFLGRGGDRQKGFEYTYHFFFGLEDLMSVFANMWDSIDTNKTVGGLFPNDADGAAWANPKDGISPPLSARGYKVLNPGQYKTLTDDYSGIIKEFKSSNCDIVTGCPIPPDLTTFWTQARQQGYRPKIATIGKAILFPTAVEAVGAAAHNLSCEVWWSPSHPFVSSLTGQSASALAGAYTKATGRQWTQPIGFAHALFELAVDVLKRTADIDDPLSIAKAIGETKADTVVGTIDFSNGPVPNVARTKLVGAQWRKTDGGQFPFDLVIVSNATAPEIPTAGKMEALN